VRLLPYGDRAVLLEVDDLAAARGLHTALTELALPGVVDLVPAARTVLVVLDEATPVSSVQSALEHVTPRPVEQTDAPLVEIPVTYDGEDLDEVARLTGLSTAEVIDGHSASELVAAFGGFAPGFAYLAGLDPRLHVPRRETPRTRVPAGSVAIAGEWAAVYPRSSPGGWRLLGRTDVVLFDPERAPPALLQPGTRVRFVRR
jgi:KipI family sensor histidine kinase inhibitor